MSNVTQLSGQVSVSVKHLLDELSERTGVKKNRILEEALWFYVRALQELPESAIVPARVVLTTRGAAAVERSLALPQAPTAALSRLMSEPEAPREPAQS